MPAVMGIGIGRNGLEAVPPGLTTGNQSNQTQADT
jgi:hypothetical protein